MKGVECRYLYKEKHFKVRNIMSKYYQYLSKDFTKEYPAVTVHPT